MKKRVFIFAISLMLIYALAGISSALSSYSCADGGQFTEEIDEIEIGKAKIINDIGIGVTGTLDAGVLKKIYANILIDARKVSLDNRTPSMTIELLNGVYTVSVSNATNENAKIKIGSSSEIITEGESGSIGGLEVFLFSTEAEYPSPVVLVAGKEKTTLSNDETPAKIVTINKTSFLIELFSASVGSASIKVKRCKNGSILEAKQNTTASINKTSLQNTSSPQNQTPANITNNQSSPNVIIAKNANLTKCNLTGFVKDNKYCNATKSLVAQKEEGKACKANYECKTDYCKSEKCSELTRFKKIIRWFKNLFS